ncbi:1-(5-phosphoribosyl)-5-[(5-phosphoribosylamino)methylideneamino] imidazole-4-carboxamide isomerase [Rhodosalinus sp.]|uniref:1-(5-phosphoribosyl)-5-[(5- phosphoribosylamino)methylideneamino] imidazole-4-carboxamide isomerase n=1 Tax=Rhodosalinus sp. TaxID=2047741 RepID=UPI00397BC03D
MRLYPAIELQNGRCVSLHRGRIEEPHVWHVDPVARARDYAAAGAEWLHVTDLDAVGGEGDNAELVEEIIRAAGIPVQVGGGIRSVERIDHWMDRGAGRVVVGTLAVTRPDLVKQAAKYHPDAVVLAVDVWQGTVTSHGWREASAFAPADFIAQFEGEPLAAIMVTDITADIDGVEEPLALVTELAGVARTPVIASGLVHSLDDIARLKYVPGVWGAVVGRPLLARDFTLDEALAMAAEPRGETAEFI